MKKYQFFSLLLAVVTVFSLVVCPAAAVSDPDPRCAAALVVDADHNQVLYSKNGYDRMYPASITKIMTSLLVLEAVERGDIALDTQVTATTSAIDSITADSSTAGIKVGEVLTVEQLIYCDLVASANEACSILAELVGGSIAGFAQLMNQRAAELGMKDTHFVNPHGLHDPNHYTTAYDIYIMAREAMKHELFRNAVSTTKYVVPATNMSGQRTLRTTNSLLDNWRLAGYTYDKAIGIKTGYTDAAGRCLASAAVDPNGRTFYCIVLGAENVKDENGNTVWYSFKESKRLLEWAFSSFRRETLLEEDSLIREIPVELSETDYVLVRPVGTVEYTVPTDFSEDDLELKVTLPESVEAPVAKGDVLGTVTVVYDGREIGTLDLVTTDSVARSESMYFAKQVRDTLAKTWVKVAIIGGVVFVLFLIVLIIVLTSRSRSRRNRYSASRRYR